MTTKALNGLPLGVVACEPCRQAVKDRRVGVVVRPDGDLYVTDARRAPAEQGHAAWTVADREIA